MRLREGLLPLIWIVAIVGGVMLVGTQTFRALNPPATSSDQPYIGIRFTPLDPLGVRVNDVLADSPAAEAGLQPGDLIYTLDGMYIDGNALLKRLSGYMPHDVIILGVQRNNQEHHVSVLLRSRPEEPPQLTQLMSLEAARNGFHLSNVAYLPEKQAWQVADIPLGSTLYTVGLREGDIITHVDGRRVDQQSHTHIVAATMVTETTYLTVLRGDTVHQLQVPALMTRLMFIDAEPTAVPLTE